MTATTVRTLALALLTAGAALAQSDSIPPDEAAKRVEEIVKKPEIYHQSCFAPERDPEIAIQVSYRGATSNTQYAVSPKQFAGLREKREGAIRALVAWLKEKSDPAAKVEEDHTHPSRTRLLMLVDLNAIEALPALKAYAERWKKAWDEAGDVGKVNWRELQTLPEEKKAAIGKRAEAAERLGDALSAIVAILRHEKFAPLLESEFGKQSEKDADKTRATGWMKETFEKIDKDGGKIGADDREYIFVDPVTGKAVSNGVYPELKVTEKTVGEILGFVDAFGKLPDEKKLGAKGMTEWPVAR